MIYGHLHWFLVHIWPRNQYQVKYRVKTWKLKMSYFACFNISQVAPKDQFHDVNLKIEMFQNSTSIYCVTNIFSAWIVKRFFFGVGSKVLFKMHMDASKSSKVHLKWKIHHNLWYLQLFLWRKKDYSSHLITLYEKEQTNQAPLSCKKCDYQIDEISFHIQHLKGHCIRKTCDKAFDGKHAKRNARVHLKSHKEIPNDMQPILEVVCSHCVKNRVFFFTPI